MKAQESPVFAGFLAHARMVKSPKYPLKRLNKSVKEPKVELEYCFYITIRNKGNFSRYLAVLSFDVNICIPIIGVIA